jgi:MFS family permease
VIEYFWTAGSLLVPVFAFISLGLDGGSWQLFCILCAIPCVISSILGTLVVPESPRWLTARGRSQQALDILRKAAITNGHEDPVALFPLDTVLTTEEEHSTMRDLVSPKWCKITLRIWGASLGMAFLYYGAILAITMIFSSTEEEEQQDSDTFNFDYTAIIASSSAEIVGLTLVILIVDTKGRIPSQTMCYVMGGTCVFLLCLFASMEMPRALLLTCSFSARLFMMGATCLTWVSTSEILATEIRSTGHAAANAISRVGGAICPFIVSERTPLLAIGCIMLFVALVTACFVHKLPETMGQGMGVAAIAEGKAHPPSSPLRNCYASTELSTLTVTPTRIPTTREIL